MASSLSVEPASKRRRLSDAPASTQSKSSDIPEWSVMDWSPEQQRAIDAALSGKNVFVTGPGGVGKTAIIPYLVHVLKSTHGKTSVITATTGVAAVALGGLTLHAFAGIGLGDYPAAKCLNMIRSNYEVCERWKKTDVLIVDEVSMLNPDYFEKLDEVARRVRFKSTQPFGGMQLILCGDFLQLPPITRQAPPSSRVVVKGPYPPSAPVPPPPPLLLFETGVWMSLALEVVKMEKSYRQDNSDFCALLNRMRYGELTESDITLLRSRVNAKLSPAEGIVPTRMYSRNADVEQENLRHLEACPLPAKLYEAIYNDRTGKVQPHIAKQYLVKSFPVDQNLQLRVGAQVMLLANLNLEQGLANGTRGVIVRFQDCSDDDIMPQWPKQPLPVVRFTNGVELLIKPSVWEKRDADDTSITCIQLPLKLAWAITIHKSQGCSLDCGIATVDRQVFEYGQAYVALSRFRTLEGLSLIEFDPTVVRAHPAVVEYYRNIV